MIIHHMLECLARQPDLTLAKYVVQARQTMRDELVRYWTEAQNVVQHYPTLFSASHDRHYLEVPLMYSMDNTTVHGIIDLLIVSEQEVHIIDYKTHRVNDAEDLTAFGHQFNEQLALYKQGVQRLYPGKAIKTSILFTALPQLLELNVSA